MEIPNNEIDTTPATLLRYVQQQRMAWVLNGDTIDKDKAEILSNISKTALDQTRIMVESNSAKGQREIAMMIAKLVNQNSENPFSKDSSFSNERVVTIPVEALPPIEMVDGEDSTDASTLCYDDFMKDVK